MMTVFIQSVDARSLNRVVAMALEVTRQEPRNLVINVGRSIALKAKELTPFVTQQRIDTELQVISTPVLSTKGLRKGLPLKSGRKNITMPPNSLAIQIVLARLWPGSDFNQRTNQRWAIDRSTFSPGGGVKGFLEALEDTAKRMVSARHSSTHFLQAGWAAVYRRLTGLRYNQPLVDDTVIDVEATVVRGAFEEFGEATISGSGSNVSLMVENLIGMKGVNAESYNQALWNHGYGPLQQAVTLKEMDMQARYLPRFEAKLAAKWNAL